MRARRALGSRGPSLGMGIVSRVTRGQHWSGLAFPHSGGSVTLGSRVCDLGPSTVCGIQLVAAAVMEESRTECHLGPPHDPHSQY